MRKIEATSTGKSQLNLVFILFALWSFIALCRPQDYLPYLAILRPTLTFGLITLLVYLLNIEEHRSVIASSQFKLYLCLILIMVIGIPFSYYRSASLRDVFDYASISMIFFLLFYHIANSVERLKSLLFVYCCGASIYAMYVMIFGNLSGQRITFGTMFDPNDMVFFLVNFFAFNLLFLNYNTRIFKRLIAISNSIICLVVMFKTGSRGGFIAIVAIFSYLAIFKTKTVNISIFKKALILSIAFISLWSLSINTERYKSILDVGEDYNVTAETGRIAIWKIGMRLMFLNPLTGVGMGRFNEGVGKDRQERGLPSTQWQTAHNSFVQVGAETGIAGFFLFLVMTYKVFAITKQIIARSESEDLIKIAEMTRVGFLGHTVCSLFLSQAYSVYWIFYIALSAVLDRMLKEEQVVSWTLESELLISSPRSPLVEPKRSV